MKKFYILSFCFLFLANLLTAQNVENLCGTNQGRSEWLKKYQAQPQLYPKGGDTTLYVAMSIHIVGTDNGTGYYSLNSLKDAFCTLNELFEGTGIQFYQRGDVDYINNSAYYNHDDFVTGYYMMREHNIPNTLNTYFVNDPAGNCGYYFGVQRAIANAKNCSGANDVTWAHEVGHALSLPHPFYGWEDDGYVGEQVHNFADAAPDSVFRDRMNLYYPDTIILDTITFDTTLVERTDGSNCYDSADGFCDTSPDYLSNRWNCNNTGQSSIVQHDPENITFQSDGSLIMSYANDVCQTRFTDEQQAAMRALIINERPEWIQTDNLLPAVESSPVAIAPNDGEDVTDFGANLFWEPVENATHYLVLVSRLSSFPNGLTTQHFTTETSLMTEELLDGKTYYWKVVGFNQNQFCSEYNDSQSFIIHHPNTSTESVKGLENFTVFPQPITKNDLLHLNILMSESWSGQLEIKNHLGQTVLFDAMRLEVGLNNKHIDVSGLPSGVYYLAISNERQRWIQKIVVQ